MYKMHVIDIFATFYIREKIVLANIAKIKPSRIKDGLQYNDVTDMTVADLSFRSQDGHIC